MGKRARICKLEQTGEVRSIHIQWADPVQMGQLLLNHFSLEEEVDALLKHGFLESMSQLKGKPTDYPDSYKGQPFGKIVVQPEDKIWPLLGEGFIRIRQRRAGNFEIDLDVDITAFESKGYDMERFFIWVDGKWWVSLYDIGRTIPVETLLELVCMESANLIRS